MQNRSNVPALDLPANMVDQAVKFGSGLERLSFAQLVVTAGRLDRTRESALRMQASTADLAGLDPDFLASAGAMVVKADCWFALVEAEMERRLSGRATGGEA